MSEEQVKEVIERIGYQEFYRYYQEKDILIKQQKQEIENLNNIIKEVREYIKEHIRIDDEYPNYMEMLLEDYKELLEILDKENK